MSSFLKIEDLKGLHITVMGLGLHGGGIETVKFLARHGAILTVTDLRDETVLAPSVKELEGLDIKFVLGRHDEADFIHADMVIKNPAVRPNNTFIALSKRVETDLSLFLNLITNPVIAVTGSKGKSTTTSAIYQAIVREFPRTKIGGNITISPLSYFEELDGRSPLVLELSSFQLGDLGRSFSYRTQGGLKAFPPFIAVMTSIFKDHQDYYGAMEPYITDKEFLFRDQKEGDHAIFRVSDEYGPLFAQKSKGITWMVETRPLSNAKEFAYPRGVYLTQSGAAILVSDGLNGMPMGEFEILPPQISIIGSHHRGNLAQAAIPLFIMGLSPRKISEYLADFKGIEHRLEVCGTNEGVTFVNDSAATIPEAALAAVKSLEGNIHLITGGTDKALDFAPYLEIAKTVKTLCLLKGTASDAINKLLNESNLQHNGVFDALDKAIATCAAHAKPGDYIMLSPGCASFGLFLHEFDRGNKFKEAVKAYLKSRDNPPSPDS